MIILKLLRFFDRQIMSLYEKVEFRHTNRDILRYRDCFETIRELNNFIEPQYLCDIGANSGDWTYVMQQMNPQLKHVVMFEPQKKYHDNLMQLRLPGVDKVIYPCGLGTAVERIQLYGGTASASILQPAPAQEKYFPGSLINEIEEIEVRTLDEVYKQDNLPYPDVIKIDVQGYELNVIKGGLEVLSQTRFLVIELSFCQFYEGQPTLGEVLSFLEENNFILVGRGYEWRESGNLSHILQVDGIFANRRYWNDSINNR